MTYLCFFRNFQINLEVKKFQNFEDLNPVAGNSESSLRGLRILPLNMAAQILEVFGIRRIYDFFQKLLNKPVVKKFQNFEDLDLVVRNCEGTLRGLRILPLIMAAQILVIF